MVFSLLGTNGFPHCSQMARAFPAATDPSIASCLPVVRFKTDPGRTIQIPRDVEGKGVYAAGVRIEATRRKLGQKKSHEGPENHLWRRVWNPCQTRVRSYAQVVDARSTLQQIDFLT